jgi:chemotaxis protein CheC
MKLDVDTLGTFYEMARAGAGLAADRLTSMTDIQTRVGVTRLNFTSPEAIRAELDDETEKVGIRVDLSRGLGGASYIVYDQASAMRVAETLVADVPDEPSDSLIRSAVVEVSQIMNNGFVDGWADVLDAEIDVSAPRFVSGSSATDILRPGEVPVTHDELAVAFRSKIETVGTEIGFQHYFVPEHESISRLFQQRSGERTIEYDKLAGFDEMTRHGVDKVAQNLTKETGIDVAVDVRRINFIALDAIPQSVPNERLVSVAFSFEGMPGGYLLFLFGRESARKLVDATVGASEGEELGRLERDAIQELSNIMASGLLDGWANLLDSTIDHSTPAYTYDMGAAVVDPLVVGLSERQQFAFVFDTRIKAVDLSLDLDIYAIPNEADLKAALDQLDVARVRDGPVAAEFETREAAPEEFEFGEFDADLGGLDADLAVELDADTTAGDDADTTAGDDADTTAGDDADPADGPNDELDADLGGE